MKSTDQITWVNAAHRKPVSSRATAVTISCFGLPRAASTPVAAMQAALGPPRDVDGHRRRTALAVGEGRAEKGVMPILPSGFDQDAPQMRVAGFGDGAAGVFGAAGMLGRNQPGEGHQARGRRETARVAEFGGDGQRGEIVDATEAAQAFDPGTQRREGEQVAQFLVHAVQPRDGLIDGADIGAVGLREGRQWPALRLQPLGVPFGPRAFGGREAAPVPQEEMGEAMPRPEEIGANVLTTSATAHAHAESLAGQLARSSTMMPLLSRNRTTSGSSDDARISADNSRSRVVRALRSNAATLIA